MVQLIKMPHSTQAQVPVLVAPLAILFSARDLGESLTGVFRDLGADVQADG